MLPVPLFTVSTPSATFHFAAPVPFADFHSERLSPSKRMIASEGGAAELAGPGLTTGGSGPQTSVSSGFIMEAKVPASTGAGAQLEMARVMASSTDQSYTCFRDRSSGAKMGFE